MSKVPEVKDILRVLDAHYPFNRVAPWDNVGLLAGEEGKRAEKILISVDVTPDVVDRAIAMKCDLLLTHHPLFIDPLKKINESSPEGAILLKILRNGLSLISAHTNADIAPRGVSFLLARAIGLEGISPIKVVDREKMYKVTVFLPEDHLEAVMKSAFEDGGGQIGNYRDCSFRVGGTGTFKPGTGTSPYLGEVGTLNSVHEERLELLVSEGNLEKVILSIRKSHPYEEPAIDVYPLEWGPPGGWLGVKGTLSREITLKKLLQSIGNSLQPSIIRYSGELGDMVRVAGVLGGSGGSYVEDAISAGLDVFITGDLKHHQVHALKFSGVNAVDMGHYDSEKLIMGEFKRIIEEQFGESITVELFGSSTECMRVFSMDTP